MRVIDLPDEAATTALAARLAEQARPGDVIALRGDLGSGKTTFARAFIRALGGGEEVPSPSFTLVQLYELAAATVWHFDLYRLRSPEEAWELGIALIEWPERLGALLPERRLDVALAFGERPGMRRATLMAGSAWTTRLERIAVDV